MEEVVPFIRDISHREQWDKNLVDIEILRELSSTDFLVHLHHRMRRCVVRAERDWLYYERACHVDNKFVMTALSVDLPEYPPRPGLTRAKLLPGTGWVLEPYDGSSITTLVSYLAHVNVVGVPPIIINRVVERQVLAVHYIRNILTPPLPPSPSPAHSRRARRRGRGRVEKGSADSFPSHGSAWADEAEGQDGPLGNGILDRSVPFEDAVSVSAFMRTNKDLKRLESVPWDMYHCWDGDKHSHTHLEAVEATTQAERSRSYSEGESAGLHSIPVLQPTLIQRIAEELEDKGQVT
jgi:hypothetical protein